tara:strand:- start:124 stop:273 length:150 start_codon:yes stop_codon:yes gene_type:complete
MALLEIGLFLGGRGSGGWGIRFSIIEGYLGAGYAVHYSQFWKKPLSIFD